MRGNQVASAELDLFEKDAPTLSTEENLNSFLTFLTKDDACFLIQLPEELIHYLLLQAQNIQSILALSQTSKLLYSVLNHPFFWQRLINKYFPYLQHKNTEDYNEIPKTLFLNEYHYLQSCYGKKQMPKLLQYLYVDTPKNRRPLLRSFEGWLHCLSALYSTHTLSLLDLNSLEKSCEIYKFRHFPKIIPGSLAWLFMAKAYQYSSVFIQYVEEKYPDWMNYSSIMFGLSLQYNEPRIFKFVLDCDHASLQQNIERNLNNIISKKQDDIFKSLINYLVSKNNHNYDLKIFDICLESNIALLNIAYSHIHTKIRADRKRNALNIAAEKNNFELTKILFTFIARSISAYSGAILYCIKLAIDNNNDQMLLFLLRESSRFIYFQNLLNYALNSISLKRIACFIVLLNTISSLLNQRETIQILKEIIKLNDRSFLLELLKHENLKLKIENFFGSEVELSIESFEQTPLFEELKNLIQLKSTEVSQINTSIGQISSCYLPNFRTRTIVSSRENQDTTELNTTQHTENAYSCK